MFIQCKFCELFIFDIKVTSYIFYKYKIIQNKNKVIPVIAAPRNESTISAIILFSPLCPSNPRNERTPSPIRQR